MNDQPHRDPQKPAEKHDNGPRRLYRRHPRLVTAAAFGVLLVASIAATLWWLHARQYEDTDDAFIDAHFVPISAEVSGAVTAVPVTDNQLVEAGTTLVRIDDRDYRAALDQANAQLEQAEANIARIDAQISAQQRQVEQAGKQLAQQQASLDFARKEAQRYQDLLAHGAGTRQRAQQATSDLDQDQAAVASAEAALAAAEEQVAVQQAQRKTAEAERDAAAASLDQARTNLSRTTIAAPVAGRVTKLTATKGAYASVGQDLLILVPLDLWVTANFKETQITHMQPGQPVEIAVDAYPDRKMQGHVDSIQSGSGTVFSLLPAQNATGNYVKVVQRVPVKIVFDGTPDVLLGPGMSVVPNVKVR